MALVGALRTFGAPAPLTLGVRTHTYKPNMANEKNSKALVYKGDNLQVMDLPDGVVNEKAHPLADALDEFIQRIDDIHDAVFTMVPQSAATITKRFNKALKAIKAAEEKLKNGSPAEASHAGASIIESGYELDAISRSRQPEAIERNLFVGMFSEFDQFTGMLIRELYNRRPDLLKSISRTITLGDLLKHDSLDSAKASILEGEIESIRRESYVEQFSILKNRFEVPLTEFSDWPAFIEASQRRNLMVHCGGVVSPQYLQVCNSVGYKFDKPPKAGERLALGPDYVNNTARTMIKVAFMLTHTLWRKVLPDESDAANEHLNDQIYRLLCAKRWRIAEQLGKFSLTKPMTRGANDVQTRIRICNTSIAQKHLGMKEELEQQLKATDWTASFRDFRLAVAILRDEHARAAALMQEIGKRGELIREISYHQWPLFAKFRETQEFQSAYEKVYGYPFYLKAERTADLAREQAEARNIDEGNPKDQPLAKKATIKKVAKKTTKLPAQGNNAQA